MNYDKIYYQLIDKSKKELRKKLKKSDINYVYYEKHHIIPKCLGGANDKENLVLLTAREHFLCHLFLIRMYPENSNLSYAFNAMCNKKSKRHQYYTPSNRMYQEAKESFSRNGLSEETKQKMRKHKPEGFGEKIRAALIGKCHSIERIQKNIDGQLKKISDVGHGHNKGSKWSDESKINFSNNRKGVNNPMFGKKLSLEHKSLLKKKKKKIIQLSLDNQFIKLWDSSKEIYSELGFSTDQIIASCKGRRASFKNFKWIYETSKN